jgi:phosphate transport system permease protein
MDGVLQQPANTRTANMTAPRTIFATKRRRPLEFLIERAISVTAFLSLAFIVLIFVFVFREASSVVLPQKKAAAPAAETQPEEYETYGADMAAPSAALPQERPARETAHDRPTFWSLFGTVWQPVSNDPRYGILPLIVASIKVASIAMLLGAPIAILAALYTTAFAPGWVRETVKPAVEILAGFPSVVIGFLALIVLASLMQHLFGYQYRLNAFVGGVALALAVIPIVFTITEDSLNAVPPSYTEASLALGAEKWETAVFVVLPAALPGIFAAVLLGLGRAIGETMIVLMATGNAALMSLNPFEPVRTMAATIGAEMAEVVFGEYHYGVLFFIGVVLFVFSFTLNVLAETVVKQLLMKRFRAG